MGRAVVFTMGAALLVATVLAVQVSAGGASFTPRAAIDPCASRPVTSVSTGLGSLAEQIVVIGLDQAACELRISRERLVLEIADPDQRKKLPVDTLRRGLLGAVSRLDREKRLPPVSGLLDEALDRSDLPGVAKTAIRAIPDRLINKVLPTDALLTRSVNKLDIPALLESTEDPSRLDQVLRTAILDAARDEILDGIPRPF